VGDHAHPPPALLADFVGALPFVDDALDLGCGDGRLTSVLRAGSITGADVSGIALERFAARLPQASAVRVEPDAPLPFPDTAFDLVLCVETIEHVRDVQLFLSEVRRVLRPDGTLALTTPAHLVAVPLRALDPLSPHIRFFSRRSLRRLLDAMGFDVVSLRRRRGTLLARASR
jgi:SAM-dependent methyltransferase